MGSAKSNSNMIETCLNNQYPQTRDLLLDLALSQASNTIANILQS